jgi:PAS domain S-box-containing protein
MELDANQMIDALPGLVWVATPDGRVEFLNQRWREYTGLEMKEAVDLGWQSAIHPDDLGAVLETWGAIIESGRAGEVEGRLRRHDGEYRRFLLRAAPSVDASRRVVKIYGINTDIEDRLKADEAVRAREHQSEAFRASERNLKLIVDATPALIWSADVDGLTESVNQHFLDYVGLNWDDLRKTGWAMAIHPEDQIELAAMWNALRTAGTSGEAEARLRRYDGEYRWFLLRASPLRDGNGNVVKWYGVNIDIEDQKRVEAKLRHAHGRLTEAQRISRTGSFTWDAARDEHIWSEEMCRIFEIDPATPISLTTARDMILPEDLPAFDAQVARGLTGDEPDFTVRIVTPTGVQKHLHAIAHRIEEITDRPVFVGAVQDVTESKRAEEALNRARTELARVARVTALTALSASIAHEVNQPLAGIITNASTCLRMLAADPPNLDGARVTAQRMLRDGNRASEVVERLRALFANKRPTIELVDLNEAAREVLALSAGELRNGRVVLRTEFDGSLPPVRGDRVQLQQVILNLVLNAADAMRDIDIRPRDLFVATVRDDDRIRLSVQDSGIGIDPQNYEKLFEAFFTTKSHGMGIGLSISRSIIESHAGRIWAETNGGHGATFGFSIPFAAEHARSAAEPQRAAEHKASIRVSSR